MIGVETMGKKESVCFQNGRSSGVKFLTKEKREKLALQQLEENKRQQEHICKEHEEKRNRCLRKPQETEGGGDQDNQDKTGYRGED